MKAYLVKTCLVTLVLGACAPAVSQEPAAAPAATELLYVQANGALSVLDTRTGAVAATADDFTVPHGWTSVLTAEEAAAQDTQVSVLDPSDAGEIDRLTVPGELELTVASEYGDLVALATPRRAGATPWLPDGRSATAVSVVEPATQEKRDFHLAGNFEPEAFSTDGRELFMIEYLPAMEPDRYRVRRLKLGSGKVLPIGRNKLAAPGQMRGTGRMQVTAPDGSQLYTLYTRQGPNYAHGTSEPHREGMVHAFVHLLDLTDRWAHCIDLPMPFGKGSATASAIAMSPAGGPLYVTDWSNGAVAKVRPERLRVGRPTRLDLGAPDDQTFAQVAFLNERLYIAGNEDIVVLDAGSLRVLDRWEMGSEVTGLLLTDDEERLFAGLGDRVVRLDAATGSEMSSLPLPGVEAILGAVRGSR
jgi:DNA-binding beta-propeller fold protein YncE